MLDEKRLLEIKAQCYRIASAEEKLPVCMDSMEMVALIQELEEHRLVMAPIVRLVAEADASVTLVGANLTARVKKDQVHAANGKVSVVISNSRTKWKHVPFVGETYGEALAQAFDLYKVVA